METKEFDVVILGAGAAGLYCASQFKGSSLKIALLEKNNKVGMKILISGGGRCNFTNLNPTFENYKSNNIHFTKSSLSQHGSHDFIDLVKKHKIEHYEKTLGQLFCKKSSKEITAMLLKECNSPNIEVITGCEINTSEQKENQFITQTSQGVFKSKALVVATGGLSFKKLGATGIGYELAKDFGHSLTELAPALVPFTLDKAQFPHYIELAGVSTDVVISVNKKKFREAILFTHKGLSGPSVLQASLHWHPGDKITVDYLPDCDLATELDTLKNKKPKKKLSNYLSELLPNKFVDVWLKHYCPTATDKDMANLNKKEMNKIVESIKSWTTVPSGTEGYVKAEVTRGGVSTKELNQKTLESKLIENLYFIGEVVDVTGWLGGYNFQWAWSSAYACGESIKKRGL